MRSEEWRKGRTIHRAPQSFFFIIKLRGASKFVALHLIPNS